MSYKKHERCECGHFLHLHQPGANWSCGLDGCGVWDCDCAEPSGKRRDEARRCKCPPNLKGGHYVDCPEAYPEARGAPRCPQCGWTMENGHCCFMRCPKYVPPDARAAPPDADRGDE